ERSFCLWRCGTHTRTAGRRQLIRSARRKSGLSRRDRPLFLTLFSVFFVCRRGARCYADRRRARRRRGGLWLLLLFRFFDFTVTAHLTFCHDGLPVGGSLHAEALRSVR